MNAEHEVSFNEHSGAYVLIRVPDEDKLAGKPKTFENVRTIVYNKHNLFSYDAEGQNMIYEVTQEMLSDIENDAVHSIYTVNGTVCGKKLWDRETLMYLMNEGVDMHGGEERVLASCLNNSWDLELAKILIENTERLVRSKVFSLLDLAVQTTNPELVEMLLERGIPAETTKYVLPTSITKGSLQAVVAGRDDSNYPRNPEIVAYEEALREAENNVNISQSSVEKFLKECPALRAVEFEDGHWEIYAPDWWTVDYHRDRDGRIVKHLSYISSCPYVWGRWGIKSLAHAFAMNNTLQFLDLRELNLRECTDISYAFAFCGKLEKIVLYNEFTLIRIYCADFAFAECRSLKVIEGFNTALHSANMIGAFYNCKSLDLTSIAEVVNNVLSTEGQSAIREYNKSGIISLSDVNSFSIYLWRVSAFVGSNIESLESGKHTEVMDKAVSKTLAGLLEYDDFFSVKISLSQDPDEPRLARKFGRIQRERTVLELDFENFNRMEDVACRITESEAELQDELCHSKYIQNVVPYCNLVDDYNKYRKYRDKLNKKVNKLLYSVTGKLVNGDEAWLSLSDEDIRNVGLEVFYHPQTGWREVYDPQLWAANGDHLLYIGRDPYVTGRYCIHTLELAFAGRADFEYLDLSGLNLRGVESLRLAFGRCSSLRYVRFFTDEDGIFEKCCNVDGLFLECNSLVEADLSCMIKMSDMTGVFANCSSLKYVNVGSGFINLVEEYGITSDVLRERKSDSTYEKFKYILEKAVKSSVAYKILRGIECAFDGCDCDNIRFLGDRFIGDSMDVLEFVRALPDAWRLCGEKDEVTPYLRNMLEEVSNWFDKIREWLERIKQEAAEKIDQMITVIDENINEVVRTVDSVGQAVDDVATGVKQGANAIKSGFEQAKENVAKGFDNASNTLNM